MKYLFYKLFFLPRKIRCSFYKFYNRLLLRWSGALLGSNSQMFNKIYFCRDRESKCEIGENFVFYSGDCLNPLTRNLYGCIYQEKGSCVKIGNNVGISSACIRSAVKIEIGDNVMIGGGAVIMDTDAHSLDYKLRKIPLQDKANAACCPIVIKNDVLIGAYSIILKGVTIGEGSVIGGGSVVTKDIPSHCIAAGNPCKVIKYIH